MAEKKMANSGNRRDRLKVMVLNAEPEPIEIDLQKTAIMIVDMQNCFVTAGGAAELLGWDISRAHAVTNCIRRIVNGARAEGITLVFTAHVLSPDLSMTKTPDSPYWYKDFPRLYREHPESRNTLSVRNTWGHGIIDTLRPKAGDVFIEKPRYSAFSGTDLDAVLRRNSIKHIAFMGVSTNCCVEASIRDAFDLGYFPILISDATDPIGPAFLLEATIFNVKWAHGWVTCTKDLLKAIQSK